MRKTVKQVAGIDVAQKELVVCLAKMYDDLGTELYAHKVFANSKSGIEACLQWVIKNTEADVSVGFVMEATGVYHEMLAYFLYQKKHLVSIVLPNKISNYMRMLETKTITDKTASEAIARFRLERKLDTWQPPKEIYRRLRQLTRERDQLVQERTIVKNQLHAEEAEAYPGQSSIKRIKARIKILNKQEQEVKAEIHTLIAADHQVKEHVKLMTSIPGIGGLTAIILTETNGFELIQNRRQLASYAGFDI